jgi:hypothetical protein
LGLEIKSLKIYINHSGRGKTRVIVVDETQAKNI